MKERSISLNRPFSVRQTLGGLRMARNDPCSEFDGDYLWWATRTPEGSGTICLSRSSKTVLKGRAWGEGADYLLAHMEEICGEYQDDGEFVHEDEFVASLHHDLPGMRIPKTRNVWDLCFGIILAQRVTGGEAARAYSMITRKISDEAPGPRKMMLPVEPKKVARIPYWWFHRYGVDRKRAEAIKNAASYAHRLNALGDEPLDVARKKLMAVPGLGLWTSASVAMVALGDQDAVPVGDYHFADQVAYALAGEARADDKRMLELLAPFAGRRGHVLRLILLGAPQPPKFGPRYSPLPLASI